MGTTWNPSDKSASIALSNGNLTAAPTDNTAQYGVRGTTSRSSGKYQLQFTSITLSTVHYYDDVGIGDASMVLGGETSAGNEAINAQNGNIFCNNGSNVGTVIPAGATVDMCANFNAKLVWFRVNGGSWNAGGTANPVTGVGGYTFTGTNMFPFAQMTTTTSVVTINPLPSGVVSGFLGWDAIPFPYAQARVIG